MDREKIEQAVPMIIEATGEDPNREGLLETPQRVARMCEEIFSGLNQDARTHLSKPFEIVDDSMAIEKDIPFCSMCGHYLLPFRGKVNIAYVLNKRVAGLSKLARTVDVYSKKSQLQERLNIGVADTLMEYLNCKGCLAAIEAEYMYMNVRGVKKPGTSTMTSVARGAFEEDLDLKNGAYRLMGL